MNKLSKTGYMIGFTVIVMSIYRWWFVYYDPSQVAIACSIGIIIYGFSYMYSWTRMINDKLLTTNKRLDAFTTWWAKQEFK